MAGWVWGEKVVCGALACKLEHLTSLPQKLGMVDYVCYSSTFEAEGSGGSQSHPYLHREFEASPAFLRPQLSKQRHNQRNKYSPFIMIGEHPLSP